MWKDATTRSHHYPKGSANNPIQPNAWEARYGAMRIYVTRAYRGMEGEWVMHCDPLNIDTLSLSLPPDATPEQAQRQAVTVVRDRLRKMNNALLTIEAGTPDA